MGDKPANPFDELWSEYKQRGLEVLGKGDCDWGAQLCALIDEYERRFTELLANRQGSVPPDYSALYARKAALDLKLQEPPAGKQP